MTSAELDELLTGLNMSRKHLARLLRGMGDVQQPATMGRRVQRYGKPDPASVTGDVRPVPPELIVLLRVLQRFPAVLAELRPIMAPQRADADHEFHGAAGVE